MGIELFTTQIDSSVWAVGLAEANVLALEDDLEASDGLGAVAGAVEDQVQAAILRDDRETAVRVEEASLVEDLGVDALLHLLDGAHLDGRDLAGAGRGEQTEQRGSSLGIGPLQSALLLVELDQLLLGLS